MDKFPFAVYVATPYTVCFGVLLTDRLVLTDARCLHPFSNGDGAPELVRGTLGPEYLMVGLPKGGISATLHNIYLSMQGFTSISLADARARTFFGLVGTYVDNSTFFGVSKSGVHAYYPQSEYVESSELNFDVGVVALTHPIKSARLAQLHLDDLSSDGPALSVLSFSPPVATSDAATLQTLYNGIELTTVQQIAVSPRSRSSCDSDYTSAYGLKNMHSFAGHKLPDNDSPIYCSPVYGNVTQCLEDTRISISSSARGANSTNLDSALVLLTTGSTTKVVSIGSPRLFEVRSGKPPSCSSNGFVQFARTGIYTDWIGWATNGTIASNGSWIDKKMTGDIIADYVKPGTAAPRAAHATLVATAASLVAAIAMVL
ncbi:hypothetical protein LPJ61_004407 [Coemansia biformis]|uniref:Peptidase S1 domain-containing protein n=1 Tax=Coemansia biformis TaxID=1286918 RepID=A0A9W8CWT0_9FUNG|nr:hypothetical protein LPJ61_004407 [Coemansia biformis]